jgi:hypothetical protein
LVTQPYQIFDEEKATASGKIHSNSKKIKINADCSRSINFFVLFAAAKKQIGAHGKSYCDRMKMGARDAETLANYQPPSSPSSLQSGRNLDPQTPRSQNQNPRSQKQNPDLKTVPRPP